MTSRIAVTGSSATSTNPVANVPTREPTVPAADSCPTIAPEPSTLRSRARVTAGVTMARAVTGSSVDTATSSTAATGPGPTSGPTSRTSGRTASTPSPPTSSAPVTTRRGSSSSAQRPPSAAPAAIPANATPITAVVDSRVSPTYGRDQPGGQRLHHEDRRPADQHHDPGEHASPILPGRPRGAPWHHEGDAQDDSRPLPEHLHRMRWRGGRGEQISSVPADGRTRWVHERCAGAGLPLDLPAVPTRPGRPARRCPAGTTEVWTDGACSGNPGPGGWAWAVPDGRQASGGAAATTNQRMEIQAALEAVRALPGPLVVVSDSTYVVNCFRDGWWRGWLARGWVNSAKKPVANRDLWEPLVALVAERGDVTFRWVKGHSGDPMNDLVDRLAVEQSRLAAAAR